MILFKPCWIFLGLLFSLDSLGEQVHVAVAANFAEPMRAIAADFERSSGHSVILTVASSGKIVAQLSHGAPYDIFLSADQTKPALLIELGLAGADSLYTYALGGLVLWSAKAGLFSDGPAMLAAANFRHLAIANPLHAPYGEAAMEVLAVLGVNESLQSKLVRGENIAQTYQFVATGNAELGFIATSQLYLADGSLRLGSWWRVPARLYSPIRQDLVLLKRAQHNPAATAMWRYLQSGDVKQQIRRHGYSLPLE
jgi:molybdate transport system substrate-binding protein